MHMNSDKPQKMIIPCILNILKEYTYDEDHAMRQEEIGNIQNCIRKTEMRGAGR